MTTATLYKPRPKTRIPHVAFPEQLVQDFAYFELACAEALFRCDFEVDCAYGYYGKTGRADLVGPDIVWEVKSHEFCDTLELLEVAIEQAYNYNQQFEREFYGVIAPTIWMCDDNDTPHISTNDYRELFRRYPKNLVLYNPASGIGVDGGGTWQMTAGLNESGSTAEMLQRHYDRFFAAEEAIIPELKDIYKVSSGPSVRQLLAMSEKFRHWQKLSYRDHSPLLDF